MIQDIAPHSYDNAYKPEPPDGNSIALIYGTHACLLHRGEDGIRYPTFAELEKDHPGIYEDSTYLFSIDEERYYLIEATKEDAKEDAKEDTPSGFSLPGFTMEDTQIFRQAEPRYRAFAGITGYQLYNWYRSRRYCGRCGSPTRPATKERMLYCDHCGNMEYPKICPAVIIGVTDGNRLLMSKYAGRVYKRYALLAGFVEIGETVEETVKREVMEEVGLKVKNIRYYKSQPWSFSESLLMGFYCDLDGDGTITLDEEELALAEWFEREEIPEAVSNDSLTSEMMMKFKHGEIC